MEVREAVNEMKSGTTPGLDGFPVECLKKVMFKRFKGECLKGGMAVLEWIVRLLNVSFDRGLYLWTGVVHV